MWEQLQTPLTEFDLIRHSRKKLVQGGYNQIAEQFSRDRIVDQVLDLLSSGQETIHEKFI